MGVSSTADSLKEALDKSYGAVKNITFEKAHYRSDIGQRALKL